MMSGKRKIKMAKKPGMRPTKHICAATHTQANARAENASRYGRAGPRRKTGARVPGRKRGIFGARRGGDPCPKVRLYAVHREARAALRRRAPLAYARHHPRGISLCRRAFSPRRRHLLPHAGDVRPDAGGLLSGRASHWRAILGGSAKGGSAGQPSRPPAAAGELRARHPARGVSGQRGLFDAHQGGTRLHRRAHADGAQVGQAAAGDARLGCDCSPPLHAGRVARRLDAGVGHRALHDRQPWSDRGGGRRGGAA